MKLFNKSDVVFKVSNTIMDNIQRIEIDGSSLNKPVTITIHRLGGSSDDIIDTLRNGSFNFSFGSEAAGHYLGFNAELTKLRMVMALPYSTDYLEQTLTISTKEFRFLPSLTTNEAYSELVNTLKQHQANDKPAVAKIPDAILNKKSKKKSK